MCRLLGVFRSAEGKNNRTRISKNRARISKKIMEQVRAPPCACTETDTQRNASGGALCKLIEAGGFRTSPDNARRVPNCKTLTSIGRPEATARRTSSKWRVATPGLMVLSYSATAERFEEKTRFAEKISFSYSLRQHLPYPKLKKHLDGGRTLEHCTAW